MLIIKKNTAFESDGMSEQEIQENYITNGNFGYAEMLTTLEVNPAFKARRNAWLDGVYIYINGQCLDMYTKDNTILDQWLASNEDTFAKDWTVF